LGIPGGEAAADALVELGNIERGHWFLDGRGGVEFPGDEVPVGNVGVPNAVSDFGAHDLADILDLLLVLTLEPFGAIAAAEGVGGGVAVFLEGLDFAGEAALEFDELGVFVGVGDEFAHEVGPEEDGGEGSRGGLETDFGEFGGVMATEKLGEVVLEGAEFEGVLLGGAPFLVAAASFPVGDVTFGDVKAAFLEGGDDFAAGQIVREHAVNHVAFEFGEAGDLAVAGFACRTVLTGLEGCRAEGCKLKVARFGRSRGFGSFILRR
jgi:hypothetical protein